MMPANAHTSKKFTRMCFEKSEVTSAEVSEVFAHNHFNFFFSADELLIIDIKHYMYDL